MDHARQSSHRRVYGDLRQLADELQVVDFTALSVGIGIGATKARERFAAPQRPMMSAAAMATPVYTAPVIAMPAPAHPSSPAPVGRVGDLPKPTDARRAKGAGHDEKKKRTGLPLEMRLVAWGTDLLFVALAVATALALAALLAAMRGGDAPLTIDEWLAVRPVQWLAGLSIYAALGGLYGIFGAYMALFKLVAGRTIGESLFLRLALVRKGQRVGQST